MKILVTGGAGFIGSHACEALVAQQHTVVALDSFDSFYSPEQKRRNLAGLLPHPRFRLVEGDYGDRIKVSKLLEVERFDVVLHLAAQAGVRPSLKDPLRYEQVNVSNLVALLEAMRAHGPKRIVAASSSSVYGNCTPAPFREDAPCMQPISPYGATKRASEIFLGTYSGLYGFEVTIVRPFTVYGPRQRPDMAIAPFTRKILIGEPLTLYGDGSTARDYTFVSDIVAGLLAAVQTKRNALAIYNFGAGFPISLTELVRKLEAITGRTARIQREPLPPGDVLRTYADISNAKKNLGFEPRVGLQEGLEKTVAWVRAELDREKSLGSSGEKQIKA
ncbi:MAG TPA: NAD-dependent epimerase/dehydratase family protein [Planctomycetota bacterium]|jgi:UDP-glucuronate 4-epimerase